MIQDWRFGDEKEMMAQGGECSGFIDVGGGGCRLTPACTHGNRCLRVRSHFRAPRASHSDVFGPVEDLQVGLNSQGTPLQPQKPAGRPEWQRDAL
ncbi:unnamed protein product [Angiostrongylus costaricensis]|uniref:Uncharacterized protein n=1 Tax=Angiostrongylus costaricensis TaxID=334426 RepID=A0A0R3PPX4_ANGCS|nr:unnamed protein product [Angiostrongylus costaricensis]